MKRLEYVDVITAGLGEREGVRGLYEGQSHTAEVAFHGSAGAGPRAEIVRKLVQKTVAIFVGFADLVLLVEQVRTSKDRVAADFSCAKF